MQIIKYEQRFSSSQNSAWCVIAVDKVEELPKKAKAFNISQGSIAWVIETGDIYGMSSSGSWELQEHITIAL